MGSRGRGANVRIEVSPDINGELSPRGFVVVGDLPSNDNEWGEIVATFTRHLLKGVQDHRRWDSVYLLRELPAVSPHEAPDTLVASYIGGSPKSTLVDEFRFHADGVIGLLWLKRVFAAVSHPSPTPGRYLRNEPATPQRQEEPQPCLVASLLLTTITPGPITFGQTLLDLDGYVLAASGNHDMPDGYPDADILHRLAETAADDLFYSLGGTG